MRSLSLFLILFFTINIYAQQQWTLEKSIEHALKHNTSINNKIYHAQISRSDLNVTKFQTYLPSISANGTQGFNFGRSIDPATNQFVDQQITFNQFSTTANWVVFDGFKSINTIKQKKYSMLSQEEELELTRMNIGLEVAHQYFKILYQKDLVENAQQQVILTKKKLEEAEAKMAAGRSTQADIYGLKVQLANEEINKIGLLNQLHYSYLNFAALLNIPAADQFDLEEPERIQLTAPIIHESAPVADHPALRSAYFQMESSRYGIAAARGDLYPRLSLFGSLSTLYSDKYRSFIGYAQEGFTTSGFVSTDQTPVLSPNYIPVFEEVQFWDQLDQNLNKAVGITLSINIFNGFNAVHSARQAKLRYLAAKELHQEAVQQTNMQITQTYHDHLAAVEVESASKVALEQAQLQYDMQEIKYEYGNVTLLEYLQAKNDLAKALAEKIKSSYELQYRILTYQILTGKYIL